MPGRKGPRHQEYDAGALTTSLHRQAHTMVRISVLYPHRSDAWFDFDYYLGTHMPMSLRLLGDAIVSVSIERGVDAGPPWAPPPYRALCHFASESAEKFAAAFLPNAAVLQDDMKKCTDIVPVIQLSEIVRFRGSARTARHRRSAKSPRPAC